MSTFNGYFGRLFLTLFLITRGLNSLSSFNDLAMKFLGLCSQIFEACGRLRFRISNSLLDRFLVLIFLGIDDRCRPWYLADVDT